MKLTISNKASVLTDDSERLFSLWNQFKPKNDLLFTNDNNGTKSCNDRMAMMRAVEFVREKRQQFTQLNNQCQKLM